MNIVTVAKFGVGASGAIWIIWKVTRYIGAKRLVDFVMKRENGEDQWVKCIEE